MINITSSTFDVLVTQAFEPWAKRAGFVLKNPRDGIFEIEGLRFTMRIRRGTGHLKGFVVTLSRKSSQVVDLDDLDGEIGLSVIAEFNGQPLRTWALNSIDDWKVALEDAAAASQAFCLPYLIGEISNFEDIEQFIEVRIATKQADKDDTV